jgi:hypothetical protein
MKTKSNDRIAYLPDGSKVRIKYVENGLATCKRISGKWRGMVAVIQAERLTF